MTSGRVQSKCTKTDKTSPGSIKHLFAERTERDSTKTYLHIPFLYKGHSNKIRSSISVHWLKVTERELQRFSRFPGRNPPPCIGMSSTVPRNVLYSPRTGGLSASAPVFPTIFNLRKGGVSVIVLVFLQSGLGINHPTLPVECHRQFEKSDLPKLLPPSWLTPSALKSRTGFI